MESQRAGHSNWPTTFALHFSFHNVFSTLTPLIIINYFNANWTFIPMHIQVKKLSFRMNVIRRSYDYYAPVVQWGPACRLSHFRCFILSITLQILWTLWMGDLDYSASLPIPGLSSKHTIIPSQQISLNHHFIWALGGNPLRSLGQVWVGITFQITRSFFFFYKKENFPVSPIFVYCSILWDFLWRWIYPQELWGAETLICPRNIAGDDKNDSAQPG